MLKYNVKSILFECIYMNRQLMLDYMRRVVYKYLGGSNGDFVMDSFWANFVEEFVDYVQEINVEGFAILEGHTDKFQLCNFAIDIYNKDLSKS